MIGAQRGTFKADLVHVVGDDKFAVALQRSTWTVKGQSYDGVDVLADRVDDRGLAVETWVYLERSPTKCLRLVRPGRWTGRPASPQKADQGSTAGR